MLKTHLVNGEGDNTAAAVRECPGEKNALVVATHPLKTYENKISFFTNSEYGININQDASTGGTPDKVHDGTDTVLWTGSQVAGGSEIIFNSTAQNHTAAGTKSVYFNRCEINDIAQFAKGSDINLTGYASLTLWIYIDNNWAAGDSFDIYCWDTDTSALVGNVVALEDYCTYNNYDVWQKISISLTDLGVSAATTADAVRIQCTAVQATKPRFYLDDIQFEQTGTTIEYIVEPKRGTWLHVNKLMIVYADAYSGDNDDGTMPNIPYNGFFGQTALVSGLLYKRVVDGVSGIAFAIKQHSDIMNFSNATVSGCGSDGTNSWCSIVVKFTVPVILKSETYDRLSISIAEDLSGLLSLKLSAGGYEEER